MSVKERGLLAHFRPPRWMLGLLALTAWLPVPAAWWASQRAVPKSTIQLDTLAESALQDRFGELGWAWHTGINCANYAVGHDAEAGFPHVAVLRNGRVFLVRGDKDAIQVIDATAGKEMPRVPKSRCDCENLDFSPDGTKLLIDDVNGTTELWDVASGKLVLALPGSVPMVSRFSPDGRTIHSCNLGRNTVSIRDANTGLPRCEVTQINQQAWGTFSKDGRLLAVPVADGIVLVDISAGQQVAHYARRSSALALAPAGEFLIVGEGFQTRHAIKLLDATSGASLATLPDVSDIEFLPDSKTLMTYNQNDHAIRLWDLPPRMRTLVPRASPWLLLAVAVLLSAVWWRGRPRKKFHREDVREIGIAL